MSRFKKAKSEQAFFKVGKYGTTGSGKTFTSLLWAEGLGKKEGKRIAYIDTEHGTDFYAMSIEERECHPEAFDFDRLITRSIMDAAAAMDEIDPEVYGVVVIDSITHLWEAAKAAYNGKMMANGGIPIQAWGNIKKPYKRMMTRFLDGKFHAIVCGREGLLGSLEDAQKKDIAAKDAQEESTVKAQQSLFNAIRKAIRDASTPEALATAWELTKGKKTKLGQLFSGLVEEMTNRRTEILSKKEVA